MEEYSVMFRSVFNPMNERLQPNFISKSNSETTLNPNTEFKHELSLPAQDLVESTDEDKLLYGFELKSSNVTNVAQVNSTEHKEHYKTYKNDSAIIDDSCNFNRLRDSKTVQLNTELMDEHIMDEIHDYILKDLNEC
eukprot:NODE_46_length_27655_cov_0.671796.p12 type:complete len:137 gc:universal NODE_46_length_27655_cov_0.671796:8214-7804(-)